MNAAEFKNLIPDYVLGKLSYEELEQFNGYVIQHPEAAEELKEWSTVKTGLDYSITEPSEHMDARFSEFLQNTIAKENKPNWFQKLFDFKIAGNVNSNFAGIIAAMSIVLLLGFGIGTLWDTSFNSTTNKDVVQTQIEAFKSERDQVRTQLVVSLADQASASKRLQAATEATKLDNVTEKVIAALFKMLNTDANVNVRLAAVNSLSKYVDNPKVREGLILSITEQESPMVQIALADLMVTLQEKKSIISFEKLLEKQGLNSSVKQKLETTINQII